MYICLPKINISTRLVIGFWISKYFIFDPGLYSILRVGFYWSAYLIILKEMNPENQVYVLEKERYDIPDGTCLPAPRERQSLVFWYKLSSRSNKTIRSLIAIQSSRSINLLRASYHYFYGLSVMSRLALVSFFLIVAAAYSSAIPSSLSSNHKIGNYNIRYSV